MRCRIEAHRAEYHRLVDEIAAYPARTVNDVALKLQIAAEYGEFVSLAAEPGQTLVAPRMLAGAFRDALRLAGKGGVA